MILITYPIGLLLSIVWFNLLINNKLHYHASTKSAITAIEKFMSAEYSQSLYIRHEDWEEAASEYNERAKSMSIKN